MSEVKEYTTCAEAIFCPSWGEYKCQVRKITITNPEECAFCGLYKKGKPSTDCHCEVCEERRMSDDKD